MTLTLYFLTTIVVTANNCGREPADLLNQRCITANDSGGRSIVEEPFVAFLPVRNGLAKLNAHS